MKKKLLVFILGVLLLATGCTNTKKINASDRNRKISKYFTLGEAIQSDYADKKRINNVPTGDVYKRIQYTAGRMDEVHKILKRPITVTSWYRSKRVNRAVGGSSTSAHTDGLGVDFKLDKKRAAQEIALLRKKMSFDQLIYYPRQSRAHIGFRANKSNERKQYFIK